jgi:hypothetical protein
MKKLFVGAAVVVAGLASAKGGNTKIKKTEKNKKTEQKVAFQQCGVRIAYYSGGQIVGYQLVTSDQPTLEACQNWQTGVKVALWAAGFSLT